MRFVCAGDLHIGAGADLSPDGLDGRLLEQELVLRQIVEAANELEAPLLWAGDAWERRRPSPAEVLIVRRQFARLQHGAIVIPGNHDIEAFERPTGYDLAADELVIANRPMLVGVGGCSIACLPWAPPGRLVALDDGVDRDQLNAKLAEGLLDIARGLFAQMRDDQPRILLGHWSITGASTPVGIPTDQFREPVLDLAELAAIGFDAVVFGHIHKPQLLSAAGAPPIFYVGSPMPLNFGEAASEHCCWLLDTDAGAFQIPIDSTPLSRVELEASEILDPDLPPLSGASFDGWNLAGTVKAVVHATDAEARRLDLRAIRDALVEAGARHVWTIQVEVQRAATVGAAAEGVDETIDDLQALELWLEQAQLDPDENRDGVRARHAEYVRAAQ